MLIFVRVRSNIQFAIGFPKNPLLKTHSNKEHDNKKLQPPNPDTIELLTEQITHSVLV